jgi:hypothetical protein
VIKDFQDGKTRMSPQTSIALGFTILILSLLEIIIALEYASPLEGFGVGALFGAGILVGKGVWTRE